MDQKQYKKKLIISNSMDGVSVVPNSNIWVWWVPPGATVNQLRSEISPTPRGCTVPSYPRQNCLDWELSTKMIAVFLFISSGSLNQNFNLGSSSSVKRALLLNIAFQELILPIVFIIWLFRNACFRNMEEISWSITWSLVYYVLVFIKEK